MFSRFQGFFYNGLSFFSPFQVFIKGIYLIHLDTHNRYLNGLFFPSLFFLFPFGLSEECDVNDDLTSALIYLLERVSIELQVRQY